MAARVEDRLDSLHLRDDDSNTADAPDNDPFPSLTPAPAAATAAPSPWGAKKLSLLQPQLQAVYKPLKLPTALKPSANDTPSPLPPTITTATDAETGSASLRVSHLVIDSGAFISGASLSIHGPHCHYLTIPAVVAELKDEQARHRFQTFPYTVRQRQPTVESLRSVTKFAQLTGDFQSLSNTDLTVLALAYEIECEVNGRRNVRERPQSLDPALFAAITDNKSMASNAVDVSLPPPSDSHNQLYNSHGDSDSGSDSEDDDGEDMTISEEEKTNAVNTRSDDEGDWITADNVHQHHEIIERKAKETEPVYHSTVACITTDYAMQNVLLQLGVRLVNVTGKSVSSIRQWLKKCHGCFALTRDMQREFCPTCGNHTLIRVTVVVTHHDDQSVSVRLYHGTRHLNKRGTKYSIPLPKGGRNGQALKLAEDMMPSFHRRQQQGASSKDLFDRAVEFGQEQSGASRRHPGDVYGYGRRNPNEPAKKTGNRRKRK